MCSRGLGEQTLLSTPGTPSPGNHCGQSRATCWTPTLLSPLAPPSRVGTHTYWLTA